MRVVTRVSFHETNFIVGLVTALNCYSVDWALKAQNVFTVAKLAAIVLMICCGIYQLSNG